ncbi:MAG TPA: DUF481 domain-containing protein [Flavobacteriaceae bacterium]|nr:DUF481 domain-containing protein [Flavobacteriaceae bacterium]
MNRALKIFIIILLINYDCFGQVVNVESMRKKTDSAKWSGSVSLNISLIKNTNNIFRVSNKAHVQYNNKKNLWLFINDLNFQKIEGSSFVNKGIQHFRYNHTLTSKIKLEAFTQAQYDAISEIDFRGLIGLGPRYKLSKNDNYRFYLGTLVMYEYEKASDIAEERIQRDFRGSTYLSTSIYPTDKITLISTSYYQPKLKSFKDFRFSNETSLLLEIFKGLAFKSTFSYNYDAFPVMDIPKAQYEFTNGLLYEF